MPFLQQSCTHIKASLSIWGKKVFHKMWKVFTPGGIPATTASQMFFFLTFFYNSSYTGFIYLKMSGSRSCRPQSTVHITQFVVFLVMSWLFSASWEHFQHRWWYFVWALLRVYSIALNTMKKYSRIAGDHFFAHTQFTGEMSCSLRND